MKVSMLNKILIYLVFVVPVAAYLDAVLIRGANFWQYLYICTWEMFICIIGVLIGLKIARKEIESNGKSN